MQPEWYKKHCESLNNWLAGKTSYLITWKDASGQLHLTQQYASSPYQAAWLAGQARGQGVSAEIVEIAWKTGRIYAKEMANHT